ncbi:hypothetical protein [Chitinophaga sp. RAB17]|uniref:hypothetical protein n=1 Tax=Chitinophaga sp. RAB17 TaxID=3233049 RepID=UPI003F925B71
MKTIVPFLCLLAIWSCNGGSKNNTPADSTLVKPDSTVAAVPVALKDTAPAAFISHFRKGEILTKGKVYTDTLTYIGFNDFGDDGLFSCVKGKDTVSLIFNSDVKDPALNNGDRIILQWKMEIYEPAGDPEFPYPKEYVVDYHLLQPGKVTLLKKTNILLQGYYDDKEISPEGQIEIEAAVWYYVANTTDTAIRNVVDVERQALQYTIEKYEGEGEPGISHIIFKTASQPVLKRVRFDAGMPYSLSE